MTANAIKPVIDRRKRISKLLEQAGEFNFENVVDIAKEIPKEDRSRYLNSLLSLRENSESISEKANAFIAEYFILLVNWKESNE